MSRIEQNLNLKHLTFSLAKLFNYIVTITIRSSCIFNPNIVKFESARAIVYLTQFFKNFNFENELT